MSNNAQTIDLSKLIKRLELIKNLVFLEEEEDIPEQIEKLQQLQINEVVEQIIIYLNEKSYGKAIEAIEIFLNSNKQVVFYIDSELEGLKLEAKLLEAEVNNLSDEKADLEKLIHEFSVRHNKELGELIIKILSYRKEQSKGTPQHEEAEKDYNDFYTNYEAAKDETIAALTETEQKELKDKYRKASKLCHPDVVDEADKEAAHKIFAELSTAYERNDLKRVTEILEGLQKGKAFASKADTANEKLALQAELKRLRLRLNELTKEIAAIKESETFETITNIESWDEYFAKTKQQLKEQLSQLENGRK
jgi:DnaJ domain